MNRHPEGKNDRRKFLRNVLNANPDLKMDPMLLFKTVVTVEGHQPAANEESNL